MQSSIILCAPGEAEFGRKKMEFATPYRSRRRNNEGTHIGDRSRKTSLAVQGIGVLIRLHTRQNMVSSLAGRGSGWGMGAGGAATACDARCVCLRPVTVLGPQHAPVTSAGSPWSLRDGAHDPPTCADLLFFRAPSVLRHPRLPAALHPYLLLGLAPCDHLRRRLHVRPCERQPVQRQSLPAL